MNRALRKAHARAWPFLALALLMIVGAAITARRHIDGPGAAAHQETALR